MTTNFSSISPIDGQAVWRGHESETGEIDAVMTAARSAAGQWHAVSIEQRIEMVRRYRDQIAAHRQEITDLIVREVGKLAWEAEAEVNAAIAKVDLSIQAFAERRSPQTLDASNGQQSLTRRIDYRPVGVVLILGPFNFPLHLPGGQIIPALLAGNTVVFKPSEQAIGIGHWMAAAWQSAGLPANVLQLLVGGPSVATRAIDSSFTSAVFLTGSRDAGLSIHRQLAGRPDVLLALELGGNNPIVVAPDAPTESVAAIVSASAFVTAGQRCTCARRVIFINSDSTASQIDALVNRTESLTVGLPDDQPPPQIGPLISSASADRLSGTYQRLLQWGCRPLVPLQGESRAKNLMRPAIVDAGGLSIERQTEIGGLEWFGPLLVIQRADNFAAAVELAANTPYGLAAALLGGTQAMFNQFADRVGAGVVNWNGVTTGAAGVLPFGGLGNSGNHRPAGFFAIDACSDPVSILQRSQPPKTDPWESAR